MSKQLHTVFIIPAPEKQPLTPIDNKNDQQHLQEMMLEMKSYWQDASKELLQPRKEVMQRLFSKVLH